MKTSALISVITATLELQSIVSSVSSVSSVSIVSCGVIYGGITAQHLEKELQEENASYSFRSPVQNTERGR